MAALTVWRICLPEFADTAFTGIGAEKFGGRFNSPGYAIVYTSGSLSLALLEMLVQANAVKRLMRQVCIPAEIDDNHLKIYEKEELTTAWNAIPYSHVSQRIGDQWLKSQESLVLRIPSVVVPQEHNFLINPRHPDFQSVIVKEPFPVPFDYRLQNH